MQSILIESQYVGSISYWKKIISTEQIWIDKHEHFVKRSYRNRCHILSANGLLRLSIPLERGKHQHAAMKDVKISNKENWQKLHWQSLQSCYRRSPYFEYYEAIFYQIYHSKTDFLVDFNLQILHAVLDILKVKKEWKLTEKYEASIENTLDLRSELMPSNPYVLPRYLQVFSDRFDFIADLSIYDLLFNQGNQTMQYLLQQP